MISSSTCYIGILVFTAIALKSPKKLLNRKCNDWSYCNVNHECTEKKSKYKCPDIYSF